MASHLQRRLLAFLLLGLALLGSACAAKGPKLHPVRGKVLYFEQPPEGATVVFHPVNATEANAQMPGGVVNAKGEFTLRTHPFGEGAPSGEYVVLITWYAKDARDQDNPVNKLPVRYSNHKAKVLTATVKEGPNDLEPFRLTK